MKKTNKPKTKWRTMQKWVSLALLLAGLILLVLGTVLNVLAMIGIGFLCCVMAALVFMPNRMRRDRGTMEFGNKWGRDPYDH